jgi:hypothetical protein
MIVFKEVPLYMFPDSMRKVDKFINVSWFQMSYFRKNIFQSTYTMDGAAEQKLHQWPDGQRNSYGI